MNRQIELYGDSILKGVTYERERNRYRLYHSSVINKLAQSGYDVNNRSHMGATITKGVSLLKKREDFEPGTTVILEYGGNDCDFDWAQIALNPNGSFRPHTPEKEFVEQYRQAIRTVRSKGADVAMLSLIPIDAKKYFSWISRQGDSQNILAWLGDVSMLSRWQEHYNRLVENLAAEEQCELIDVRHDFLLSHRFSELLGADGIHPTQTGHDMIVGRIADHLMTA